jgi:hypothetical protein
LVLSILIDDEAEKNSKRKMHFLARKKEQEK